MNNDYIERKMNFIVEQQAQFATDIQKLQESQAKTEKAVAHLAETVAKTVETVSHAGDFVIRLTNYTHNRFDEFDAKMNALIQAQLRNEESIERLGERAAHTEANIARLEENVARTEANVARTEANVARTDESLKKLIAAFDRDRRERRNGK